MSLRCLIGFVLALLLSGCASIPQHLPRNPRVGAATGPHTPQAMRRTTAWPEHAWWRALHDHTLDQWVTRALANNPDLHAAAARVLAAQATIGLSNARRLPHFNANLSFTQQYFSAQGLHPGANGTSNLYTEINPLQIQYHVDLWGRDRALVQAARGAAQIALAEQAQTRLLLSTAVVLRYAGLMGDKRLLRQELALVRLQRHALALAQVAYRTGIADEHGQLQLQVQLATSSERIASLRAACAAERHALAELAGEGPGTVQATPSGALPLPSSRLPENLPLGLLAHRPDIVAARWAVEAAAARVHAARAAFYPDLNLRLLAGWNSINLADLFNPANFAHAVGPVLSLPIFTGGALRAQLRGQNAQFLEAQDQYQGRVLAALRQVADTLSAWEKLREQRHAQQQVLATASRQEYLAQGVWQSGMAGLLPKLRSQIQYLQAEEKNTRLQTASIQNWALLESALGGGYRSIERKSVHGGG
ncbi:efflux transporter outer membrane subunit [Acidithiobacillus sp. IBUN Pt1247-S3]|uniref:efflux transporter outer membrane subunit n=1 Tax=Acidithiobacillus sp. IBUN Pt1247-S3 TaxID=3166642 RepID=UPI0034E3C6D7